MALPGQVRGGVWDEEEEEEACEGPGEAEEGRLPGLARELRRALGVPWLPAAPTRWP